MVYYGSSNSSSIHAYSNLLRARTVASTPLASNIHPASSYATTTTMHTTSSSSTRLVASTTNYSLVVEHNIREYNLVCTLYLRMPTLL